MKRITHEFGYIAVLALCLIGVFKSNAQTVVFESDFDTWENGFPLN